MTRPWLAPLPEAAARRAEVASAIPVLETERLILRAPKIEDWDALEPIWRSDRGRYIGGPFSEEDAWLDFAQCVASWPLRGIGAWTVTRKSDGQVLGITGPGQEPRDAELELGWLFTEAAEGHGYAYEAAGAVREHLFAMGFRTFVSCIDPGNTRSVALAERLGAGPDPDAARADPGDLIYRHSPKART